MILIFKKLIISIFSILIIFSLNSSFEVNASTVVKTKSITSSTNSFDNSIEYNDGVYIGTLYKDGDSFISSGSYTPAHTKMAYGTKWWSINYVEVQDYLGTKSTPPLYTTSDTSPEYYAWGYDNSIAWTWIRGISEPVNEWYEQDGYTGYLKTYHNYTPIYSTQFWDLPAQFKGAPKSNVECYFRIDQTQAKGNVTKPAIDTRIYTQNYKGTVIKIATGKPTAIIEAPINAYIGSNISVTGSGIDPDNLPIVEYIWTTSNGQSLTGTGGNITVNSSVTLTLKVKNSANAWSDVVTHTINATAPINKPIAIIEAPLNAHTGETVNIVGRGSDPGGLPITEYLWTTDNSSLLTGTGGSIQVDRNVNLTLKVKNSANVWSDVVTHTINTTNNSPEVTISLPPTVYSGDDLYVSAEGFDGDGDVLEYFWNKPGNMKGTLEGGGGFVYFNDLGIKKFGVTVIDASGDSAYATAETNVIAPTPIINIVQTGTLKENRKVIIDTSSSSGGSQRATITTKKYIITALNGSSMNDVKIQTHTVGSTNGTILYDSSKSINVSLDSLSTFDMTFKKAGQYKIDCTMVNNYGKSSTNTITLNVIVDAPPVALLSMPSKFYRDHHDPNKFNGLYYAVIPLTNSGSYSADGDPIEKIAWFYSFDINNNDTIDDPWYVYNATTNNWDYSVKYTVEQAKNFNLDNYPVGYLQSVNIESAHVGVFYGGILCKEGFGQEYIPQFVTDADKKTSINFDE